MTSTTVLVQVEEERVLPSRLMACHDRTTTINKMLAVRVLEQNLELHTPSSVSEGRIGLGPFLTSSNIELEEDEVEVFPVLVIRPRGQDVVEVVVEDKDVVMEVDVTKPSVFVAHRAYLSDVEYTISASESNF